MNRIYHNDPRSTDLVGEDDQVFGTNPGLHAGQALPQMFGGNGEDECLDSSTVSLEAHAILDQFGHAHDVWQTLLGSARWWLSIRRAAGRP